MELRRSVRRRRARAYPGAEYIMARITRVFAAVMVGGLGLAVLSGCTPAREATVMETPELIWIGAEPASEFEADPGVQYLREYNLAQALAWNTGDFTLAQLTSAEDADVIVNMANSYAHQGDFPFVYRGPAAFEPIAVETDDANRPAITVCEADESVFLTGSNPGTAFREIRTTQITFHLRQTDTGTFRIDSREAHKATEETPACLAVTIPLALFVTRPVMPDTPVTEPVREPLESEDD